jgi:hypothetical protein
MTVKAVSMEELISGHWQVMGEVDRKREVKLIVDEWGPTKGGRAVLTVTNTDHRNPVEAEIWVRDLLVSVRASTSGVSAVHTPAGFSLQRPHMQFLPAHRFLLKNGRTWF